MFMRFFVVACCFGVMAQVGHGQDGVADGLDDGGLAEVTSIGQFNGPIALSTTRASSTGWFGWSKAKSKKIRDRMTNEEDDAVRQRFEDKFIEKMTELIEREDLVRKQELKRLEARIAKLKSSLTERGASHERIAKDRYEAFMSGQDSPSHTQAEDDVDDLFSNDHGLFGAEPQFTQLSQSIPATRRVRSEIEKIVKRPDGSHDVSVRYHYVGTKQETRTREMPYTVMVPQKRTRIVNGTEQSYTVLVPETRTRTVNYGLAVPNESSEIKEIHVPKGQDVVQYVTKRGEWKQASDHNSAEFGYAGERLKAEDFDLLGAPASDDSFNNGSNELFDASSSEGSQEHDIFGEAPSSGDDLFE